ncbi:MAG: hypothetical protein Q8P68_03415 [Candidatus Peregrinibacteria bacterium]|nr:hypothetical protein [Candidatus Peregrinibacteria bacterium]MDZ4244847.1 hypothetical protein [Candidatus Gracilibacteria bacterium]
MKLIVTALIGKMELEPIRDIFNLDILKIAAKKSLQGLGKNIKSTVEISGTILSKVYLTSSDGAGRVVFLLKVKDEKSVLIMIRHKNDKRIGANMTVQNTKFRKVLEKNLDLILSDLKKGDYEEIEL